MGYRSTVKIIAGKNAAAELIEVNKKHKYFAVTPGSHEETLFEADWIKWYEEEDDIAEYVAIIDKYLNMVNDDESDDDYDETENTVETGNSGDNGIDFYRIGEDSEDVEHRSTYSTHATLDLGITVSDFEPQPEPKG